MFVSVCAYVCRCVTACMVVGGGEFTTNYNEVKSQLT